MKRPPANYYRRHAPGFSLVEVMVAVVVICVGLLGIAKMQAMALSNTNMSRQRSLAAIEAASFAASMHANRLYWGTLANAVTVTLSAAGGAQVVGDAALQAQTTNDLIPANLNDCVGVANGPPKCPLPVNLAAFDLARWWANSVSLQLPNPTATVTCPQVPPGNAAPVACTIQISWTEKAVAINTAEATQAANEQAGGPNAIARSENPTFTLYVEP
jgi:type IV pilus assembly protein PilV